MSILLLLAALLPLALAPLVALPSAARRPALRFAPWAALPALALAVGAPASPDLDLPWFLLGGRVGLDVTGRVFLLFTALLWTVAGLYARSYLRRRAERYFVYHLLSLTGNLGLIVSLDLATFYLFFSLMTFAAYGLVVHAGSPEARWAGRVYVALAVLGEAMLLAGGILAAASAPGLELRQIAAALATSPRGELASTFLFLGFGVKAGIMPLHVWLPLAHPVAPTPASAVLSGSMIKAGLLGWIRLLPAGAVAMPELGAAVVGLGLATAFLAALIGLAQGEPKTILAYSSVSQMGLMTIVLGVALLAPEAAPAALGALLAYASHHALVKGALFLGVGVVAAAGEGGRRPALAGLTFAALAMVGAPLTSGEAAKHHVKEAAHLAPGAWADRLDLLLSLSVVATTLLMARFLVCSVAASRTGEERRPATGLWTSWVTLLIAMAAVLWLLPRRLPIGVDPLGLPHPLDLWTSLWPVTLGVAITGGVLLLARTGGELRAGIPPGDLLAWGSLALAPVRSAASGWTRRIRVFEPISWVAEHWYRVYAERQGWAPLRRAEVRLMRWSVAGVLLVMAALVLIAVSFGLGAAS